MNQPVPCIGMGATICYLSDRVAATIVYISPTTKTIWAQEDKSIRTDNNGISESQDYIFELDSNGIIHKATLRKDGIYRVTKSRTRVIVGQRDTYKDPCF